MGSTIAERLKRVAGKQTLRLTHYGRKSGKPYEVTIWFIADGDKVYLSTGNVNRQWVRNVKKTPRVRLSIGGEVFDGEARFLADPKEQDRVMKMVRRKYWMFLPMIVIWWFLAALGIVKYAVGAFEVILSEVKTISGAHRIHINLDGGRLIGLRIKFDAGE
jgi:deazaflavin-dependent oxidoreductase (nitroreductase family)